MSTIGGGLTNKGCFSRYSNDIESSHTGFGRLAALRMRKDGGRDAVWRVDFDMRATDVAGDHSGIGGSADAADVTDAAADTAGVADAAADVTDAAADTAGVADAAADTTGVADVTDVTGNG